MNGYHNEQKPDTEKTVPKTPALKMVTGRALIDLKAHNLKAGQFGTLPADVADALSKRGHFDLKARQK